jgi:hypothetical protein
MTIKVGDMVQVHQGERGWSTTHYRVLAIQDRDPANISSRKWAVVAYLSDIPKVHYLHDVRKVPVTNRVVKQGVMVEDGSIILNHGVLYPELHTAVEVHCTEVDGVVDLTYGYSVSKKEVN